MAKPNDSKLAKILNDAATIAVVGASSKRGRSSRDVMKVLIAQGYNVIPVNPNESKVLGRKAYASLTDIPADIHVDIVDVFRKAAATPAIAQEAAKINADTLWLQLDITNDEAAQIARKAGMTYIEDECMAVEIKRLNIPKKLKPCGPALSKAGASRAC